MSHPRHPYPGSPAVLQPMVMAEREADLLVTHEPVAVFAGIAGKASARNPMVDAWVSRRL